MKLNNFKTKIHFNKKDNFIKTIIKFIFLILNLFFIKFNKVKIGVIGLAHSQNVGNNLLKFAIFIKLKELNVDPYIIGIQEINKNITLLKSLIKLEIINNFQEINKSKYNILMVNSDQTWRKYDAEFYDIAFLKFAEKWNIPKFVYGASLGLDYWNFSKQDEIIAKNLIKNFTGISVREIGSIKLIKEHLNITPSFVLDPTFLIDKKYYLDIVKYYKNEINIKENYIFTYKLKIIENIEQFIKYTNKILNLTIYDVSINDDNCVQNFIYGIYYSKAVITNSYHGVIFSIIFNKPFIAFMLDINGNERFKTLIDIFEIKNRIYQSNQFPDPNLLNIPLNINQEKLKQLKNQSIEFLKKNIKI